MTYYLLNCIDWLYFCNRIYISLFVNMCYFYSINLAIDENNLGIYKSLDAYDLLNRINWVNLN